MEKHRDNMTDAQHIIKEMRIIHGCAVYDKFHTLSALNEKDVKEIPESEWINISAIESMLYLIHSNIRYCETLLYKMIPGAKHSSPHLTDVATEQTSFSNAMKRSPIKMSEQSDVITIQIPESETPEQMQLSEFGTEKPTKQEGGMITEGLTDKVNNLTSTEARYLVDEGSKMDRKKKQNNWDEMTGGHHPEYDTSKPTIVNYWADWCGFSKKFMPSWMEFKEMAKTKYPGLQTADLNVSKDNELNKLANQVGVEGYPTLVLFYNGKTHKRVAGKMTAYDVCQFVDSVLN